MTTYLLDADVLVALVVEEHDKHPQVMTWAGDLRDSDRVAVCPVFEGALVRFLVRVGVPAPGATLATLDRALAATWPQAHLLG